MNYVIYRLYLSFEGTREGRAGSSNRNGPVFYFFILISGHDRHVNHNYHHCHEWCQWRRQMMTVEQRETTTRTRAQDALCVSSPGMFFFSTHLVFLYSFLFLFILISGHDRHVNHHHHHEWHQWWCQTMAAGQRETMMRMRAWDAHCVSSIGMFFSYQNFFFSFFIHFRLCPPRFPQPPPPLPSWTAPMMRARDTYRLEPWYVFFFSIVYLQTTAVCMRPQLPLRTSSNLVPGLVLCLD